MYPLNVSLPAPQIGYAVANDADEHKALAAAGYEPAFVAEDAHTVESVRAQLDALGVEYDKRSGLAKLLELLPK